MTLRELLHWIVATVGLTETLVMMLLGLVWLVSTIWTRYAQRPLGRLQYGIWVPLAYCVCEVFRGLRQHWQFYRMMIAANAFNEEQASLYWESTLWGAGKLSLVGLIGTLLILATVRRNGPQPANSQDGQRAEEL